MKLLLLETVKIFLIQVLFIGEALLVIGDGRKSHSPSLVTIIAMNQSVGCQLHRYQVQCIHLRKETANLFVLGVDSVE